MKVFITGVTSAPAITGRRDVGQAFGGAAVAVQRALGARLRSYRGLAELYVSATVRVAPTPERARFQRADRRLSCNVWLDQAAFEAGDAGSRRGLLCAAIVRALVGWASRHSAPAEAPALRDAVIEVASSRGWLDE